MCWIPFFVLGIHPGIHLRCRGMLWVASPYTRDCWGKWLPRYRLRPSHLFHLDAPGKKSMQSEALSRKLGLRKREDVAPWMAFKGSRVRSLSSFTNNYKALEGFPSKAFSWNIQMESGVFRGRLSISGIYLQQVVESIMRVSDFWILFHWDSRKQVLKSLRDSSQHLES